MNHSGMRAIKRSVDQLNLDVYGRLWLNLLAIRPHNGDVKEARQLGTVGGHGSERIRLIGVILLGSLTDFVHKDG